MLPDHTFLCPFPLLVHWPPLPSFFTALASASVSIRPLNPTRPKPLVTHIYTADPSAHAFNGTIYIYPSHDVAGNVPKDDEGAHFNMPLYFIPNSNRVSLNGRISTT